MEAIARCRTTGTLRAADGGRLAAPQGCYPCCVASLGLVATHRLCVGETERSAPASNCLGTHRVRTERPSVYLPVHFFFAVVCLDYGELAAPGNNTTVHNPQKFAPIMIVLCFAATAGSVGWPSGSSSTVVSFASGALAGAAATVASYPFDLLRTTLAAQGEPKVRCSTGTQCRQYRQYMQAVPFRQGLAIQPYALSEFVTEQTGRE